MRTINEIKNDVICEISKVLIKKGYDITKPIVLNDDEQFEQQSKNYDDYYDAPCYCTAFVNEFEVNEGNLYVTAFDSDGVEIEYCGDDLTIEQLYEFYNSICNLAN